MKTEFQQKAKVAFLKFSPEHLASLKGAIKEKFDRDGYSIDKWLIKYQDMSETRMLWDLYWLSGWSQRQENRTIVDQYFDAHIQSALRYIVKNWENI